MGYMDRGSLKGSIHVDTTPGLMGLELEKWENGRISGKVCKSFHAPPKKIKDSRLISNIFQRKAAQV